MDYLEIVHLNKEPFSNSPDPEFFFQSRQHVACLQKLELSLRLRRGLNVVIGDIGTGKTTLCRQIIRRFASKDKTETHLILDPNFSSQSEFLNTIAGMFGLEKTEGDSNEWQMKEKIKRYLFQKGVDDEKKTILIIDEGQKIPVFCLEILREFLNYETNEYKLLQIVIFAQREFQQTLKEHANFADRINVSLFLGPLNFRESRLMIKFRLDKASMGNSTSVKFSYPALWAIYKATGGYPRKIINLCHQIILTLIIQNRFRVSWALVRSCAKRLSGEQSSSWRWAVVTSIIFIVVLVFVLGIVRGQFKDLIPWKADSPKIVLKDSFQVNTVFQDDKRNLIQETPVSLQIAAAQLDPAPLELDENMSAVLPETTEESLPEKTPALNKQKHKFPRILGQIKAERGETVLGMIHRIYGVPEPLRLREILSSMTLLNPKIKDFDGIYVGDVINFPALPETYNTLPSNAYWIQLIEEDILEKAYQFIRSYRNPEFSVRILPYWNSRYGLKFAVLIKAYFHDRESAEIYLKKLPSIISSGAKIVIKWDNDTVFFSKVPVDNIES